MSSCSYIHIYTTLFYIHCQYQLMYNNIKITQNWELIMSDLINHYYCGEEALKYLNNEIKEIILNNIKLFNLGTQGPDFFLYQDIIPWKKHNGYNKLGIMLHTYESNLLFEAMFEHILSIEDMKTKNEAIAYIMGYICHHSLDSISHPYIFYFSGQNSHLHKEFEKNLDILNSTSMGKIAAVDFPFSEVFDLSEGDITTITQINMYVISKLFHIHLPNNAIPDCLDNFNYLIKLFPDKKGIKQKIFRPIETIAGQKFAVTKALIHKDIKDKDDYLNLNHKIWIHPCNEKISSNESYPDLFNKSVIDSSYKIKTIYNAIKTKSIDAVSDTIKNSSFETGEVYKYINHINTTVRKYSKVKNF